MSEIIGPAGSAMQRLPPTVAMFQILNEARKDRQHRLTKGAAVQCDGKRHGIELGNLAGRGDAKAMLVRLQRRPAQIGDIDQPRDFQLRFGE